MWVSQIMLFYLFQNCNATGGGSQLKELYQISLAALWSWEILHFLSLQSICLQIQSFKKKKKKNSLQYFELDFGCMYTILNNFKISILKKIS